MISTSQMDRSGSTKGLGTAGRSGQLLARFAGSGSIGVIDTALEQPDNTNVSSAISRNSRKSFVYLADRRARSGDHHIGLISLLLVSR